MATPLSRPLPPSVTFTIPGAPSSLSNLRGWRQIHDAKSEWRIQTFYRSAAARILAGWIVARPEDGLRHVIVTMHRRRLLDPDNAVSAVKGIIDGLKSPKPGQMGICSGLIYDDSTTYLDLSVRQVLLGRRDDQHVSVLVLRNVPEGDPGHHRETP